MLTIVFYSTNGSAAKLHSREIAATAKGNYARCYDVAAWDGTYDKCDSVEIMPDVPGWQRDRITKVYGAAEEYIQDESVAPVEEILVRQPMGLMPPRENNKKAVHRGGGRWFVMDGEQIMSGPHDKAEAAKFAATEDAAAA